MTDDVVAADVVIDPFEACQTEIVAQGGRTLLIGGADVGKTTFVRRLVSRFTESGKRVAILDADLGQSEIGPPACVGLAIAEPGKPLVSLTHLEPSALKFVGSLSPAGCPLELVSAVRALADLVPPEVPLIVDTGGFIHGASAVRLFGALIDLLRPDQIVSIHRKDELKSLLAPFRFREDLKHHSLSAHPEAVPKPPQYRSQRRALRFAHAFEGATTHTYSFDEIAFAGTWLATGEPVAPHILKFLSDTLGKTNRVYYAEKLGDSLGVMAQRSLPPQSPALSLITQTLKVRTMAFTVAPKLKSAVVGLESSSGKLLAIGSLDSLDFRRRELGVIAALRAEKAVRCLRLGTIRVTPEGEELGEVGK